MVDPVVVESWHLPRALSDEALRLLTTLPMEEIERRLRMDGPAGHERPTDEQLDDLFVEIDGSGETQSWRAFARAVLACWGAAASAADGEAVELPPRPPLMEPPAHLALERYGITWDGSPDKPLLTRMADGYWTPWHVAADLLERQALAEPGPETPTDKELLEMMAQSFRDDLAAVSRMAAHGAGPDITPGLFRVSLNTGALDFARAVLARWGAADKEAAERALRPIPVSERLPGPEDCDAESRCWRWNTIGRLWTRQQYARKWYEFHSHWLPAHALPLPEVE